MYFIPYTYFVKKILSKNVAEWVSGNVSPDSKCWMKYRSWFSVNMTRPGNTDVQWLKQYTHLEFQFCHLFQDA